MACIDARAARSDCLEYVADLAGRGLSLVLWAWHDPNRFAQTEVFVVSPETDTVVTPSAPWGLVLYDPPVAEDWLRVWGQLAVESLPTEVHILYGPSEAKRAAVYLDADWPDVTDWCWPTGISKGSGEADKASIPESWPLSVASVFQEQCAPYASFPN